MAQYAYFKKQFMPLKDASLGLMTNFMHYGTAVFEGIRGNWNEDRQQIYLFRLKEHYERLLNGCKVLKIDVPYSIDELCRLTVELVARSGLKENVYIRPLAYKSQEAMGVRLHDLEADFFIFVMPWGRYIDSDKCRVGVSSWRRPGSNFSAPQAKIAGQYINSAFAKTEAHENGYDEAILLNEFGRVAEGSGENIFLIADGQLLTPSVYESILTGITRNTVIELAYKELDIRTVERPIERSELYTAQEAFFTGTAAHIAPIAEIDHRPVGNGEIGPVTRRLQELYYSVIEGKNPRYFNWCTPVY
ncbi:MAG: branched-chain amino acid transaminase [Dehalococcoidales bacterium]|nr:branched-chain amino acid transaminase [Dehalococcoidales bacterium]